MYKPNQTKRNHCLLTVFLVGVMGFVPAALGSLDCSIYPLSCFHECLDVKLCRANGPTGGEQNLGCHSEELSLSACLRSEPAIGGYPPLVNLVPPKSKPVVTYHAGTCVRGLRPLPQWLHGARIRHDDVQSYKMVDGNKTMEETSGFYPVDYADAMRKIGSSKFTLGHHTHDATSTCTLPKVDKATFDSIRSRAGSIKWTRYHALSRSCYHWSNRVVTI